MYEKLLCRAIRVVQDCGYALLDGVSYLCGGRVWENAGVSGLLDETLVVL